MRKLIHYSLAVALLAPTWLHAQDNSQSKTIAGNWQGSIQTSPPRRIVLKISVMDKPVIDRTGLTNRYDFTLNWTPDQSQFAQMGARIEPVTEDPNALPTLYTALQEQLGLKLEPTKAATDVLVIDHIEMPAAN
jgi:uncharacterized protein (TIGR03435 family)